METKSPRGHTRDLFVLPFDHRSTFLGRLFHIHEHPPTDAEIQAITRYKGMIYEGFQKALALGVPRDSAALLVDEKFGSQILRDARRQGYQFACPTEKSNQTAFEFEHGDRFADHLGILDPTFAKALMRFNPANEPVLNQMQLTQVKRLADYCAHSPTKLALEIVVPPTSAQLREVGGDTQKFDRELRPALCAQAIREVQEFGIEPDIWHIEGFDAEADYRKVSEVARADGRNTVGLLVLGRGEKIDPVRDWVRIAARVPGMIGFTVGRTLFWDAILELHAGRIPLSEASDRVARNYAALSRLWLECRKPAIKEKAEGNNTSAEPREPSHPTSV